ncbi:MAG: CHASE2 domain-containing protein [Phormidesmis sp.]
MNQRIVIKIGSGSIETGYAAAVQIGDEGMAPRVETQAHLPPAPDLPLLYRQWQQAYWRLGLAYRLEAQGGITNVSAIADTETCLTLSRQLRDRIHHWLNGDDFRPIREKLLEQLSPHDTVRFLLQTQDTLLQRLPWYELQFYERYRLSEVGICAPDYQQTSYQSTRSNKVRILAVIGDATGLNTQIDLALLQNLPDADIHLLKEPNRETFNRCLWDAKGWDILFFAGHSSTRTDCHSNPAGGGEMLLNATDSLTIPQLKHALKKAIERGLNTAIFNSCDGLGLAADLADLHIPQVLVMREPVPDPVAHAFLQGFLESFAAGSPFYVAVREAREKLQGLEARFPCATWLPVIVQNPAETPPTWHSLQGKPDSISALSTRPPAVALSSPQIPPQRRWRVGIGTGIVIAAGLLLGRQLGWLAPYELKAYDHLLRLRPPEAEDSRLLIILNTEDDIAQQPDTGSSSLTDQTLLDLLNRLTPLNPQLIGLDIYRSQPTEDPDLAEKMNSLDSLIAICKVPDRTTASADYAPPPEIKDPGRIGASDFVNDDDQVLRRHLMYLAPVPGADCQAGNTFSTVMALRYLEAVHNIQLSEDNQFLGTARLPIIKSFSFGGYHDLDTGGIQALLNYRILRDPVSVSCGEVKESPADCLTVSEVLSKDASKLRSVEGRIILIGTTDMNFSYEDRWITPYNRTSFSEDQTPGVFLQAQMISQMISAAVEGRPLLSSWPEWLEMVWIASWAVGGGLIGVYSRWGYRLWLRLLLAEGLLLLACWLGLIRFTVWLPWVPGAIALPAAALTGCVIFKAPVKELSGLYPAE